MITVTEAGSRLGMRYGQVRDWLMVNSLIVSVNGRAMVDEHRMVSVAKRLGIPIFGALSMQDNPMDIPVPPPNSLWISKRQLILNGPFFGGIVADEHQVDQVLIYGKWRVRALAGSPRTMLHDWQFPDSWATPLEKNVQTVMEALSKGIKKAKPKEAEAINALLVIALEWHTCLKEWRIGLSRGMSHYTAEEFVDKFEKAKRAYYKQEWKQKILLPMYPKDFEVMLYE
jgi:hypothetical protein